VWWWLATRTNLHRSNENIKNIGEERRTEGRRRRPDGSSGLAGPHAQATEREDAWQEPHSPPTSTQKTGTARTENRRRDAGENAAKRAAERTNQPARQTTRPRRRQTERPTEHQPAQPDPRSDAAAVRLRPSLQPSSRRRPSPTVQTGARFGSSPWLTAHQGRGERGRATHPGGEICGGMRGRAHVLVRARASSPCARAFERDETGSSRRPPPARRDVRFDPPTPWPSLSSRADIRNPVSSNPPFRSVRLPGC
jgi:hypothetical protein